MAGSAHSIGAKLTGAWLFANTSPSSQSDVDRAPPALGAHTAAEAKDSTLDSYRQHRLRRAHRPRRRTMTTGTVDKRQRHSVTSAQRVETRVEACEPNETRLAPHAIGLASNSRTHALTCRNSSRGSSDRCTACSARMLSRTSPRSRKGRWAGVPAPPARYRSTRARVASATCAGLSTADADAFANANATQSSEPRGGSASEARSSANVASILISPSGSCKSLKTGSG